MTRQISLLIILTVALSCNSGRQENNKSNIIGFGKPQKKTKENIRFNFSAERISTVEETIEIKATLYNDNADTAYFLSATCEGEQYSLRYDTSKFVLTPFLNCNANSPRIIKITPNGKHDFQAHFMYKTNMTKINLGFDFYAVNKSFDLTNKNSRDINIFNRPENIQTIIWADEKTIK